ncbi:hypothetical protein K2X83_01295 [Patescibacteria group bacterium]|nr:hypothetical protein [Patescibacteria group bacterium]
MGESLLAAPATLGDLVNLLTQIVIFATPFAILLLFFFWNLFQLLTTVEDAEKKKQARDRIIFGVIVLFVVFTLTGLVAVLQRTFFGDEAAARSFRTAPLPAPVPQPDPLPPRGNPGGDAGGAGEPTAEEPPCPDGGPQPCDSTI